MSCKEAVLIRNEGKVLRNIVLLGIVVGVILPLFPQLLWSFAHSWRFPSLLPAEWSMRAWSYVSNPRAKVIEALCNSTIIAISVSLLDIFIAIPAARVLGMHSFRGKGLIELIILAPTIVPPLAVTMGIQVIFIRIGLADTLFGVILVHMVPTLPYMTIALTGVFSNYDPAFEEQAYSLGANPAKVFFFITLPAIFPGLVTGAMFAFLVSWSQYVLTMFVGGGRIITLPVLLFSFANSGDNAIASALSIIFVLPAVLILVFTSKYLSGRSEGMGGFVNL